MTAASGGPDARPAPRDNLIVEGLSKTFGGVRALDNVSLSVARGEVHGLLGQNGSGKSTLIKILGGIYSPDPGGRVQVGGRALPLPLPPGEFSRYGIAIVHQALGLVPSLSVTENLFVRRLVRDRNWRIDWGAAHRAAAGLFDAYGLSIDPAARVADLSSVERALLAIVRAFQEIEETAGGEAGLLILDEPTPFLSGSDVRRLFDLVRSVAAKGTSVIFVSHDVDEVLELTDRATVLRNGRTAATLVTRGATKGDFVAAIVGRSLAIGAAAPRVFGGPAAVTVSGLAGAGIEPLDLSLHAGEIIGLTGLIGSGYDQVPYFLYGASRPDAGWLEMAGTRLELATMAPARAFELGMILIPADRQGSAVVESLPVADNIALPMLGRVIPRWLVTERRVGALAREVVERFDIRPPDPTLPVRALSGGNQQKVVLAKWLQVRPRLILLDEPTQGVDVGARQQVFEIIREAARNGACVLCASSDHDQLAAIADCVLVFSRGRITATLVGAEVTKDAIADRCFGSLGGVLTDGVGERRAG